MYNANDQYKLISHTQLDTFDLSDICWAPNGHYIVGWDNCVNYKFVAVCPLLGVTCRYSAYEDGLGIKSVEYSNSSMLVAVGSYDDKVRLINGLTWKVIG